uniref:Uncharacterized protein n=1 Tax=Physcomitrium patens TaxID=3218 RepID=A0A2K1J0R4_PHYPA|nr:hypothetical protein PHYPA_023006 [Physcomitrium patens]
MKGRWVRVGILTMKLKCTIEVPIYMKSRAINHLSQQLFESHFGLFVMWSINSSESINFLLLCTVGIEVAYVPSSHVEVDFLISIYQSGV